MVKRSNIERIKRALETGQLFVTDEAGYRRFIHARCPKEGNASPVCRQDRVGQAFTRLVFRCPLCGTEFESPVKSLFLQ